jgi:hypothetical protein
VGLEGSFLLMRKTQADMITFHQLLTLSQPTSPISIWAVTIYGKKQTSNFNGCGIFCYINNTLNFCETSGFHGGEYEDQSLLGYSECREVSSVYTETTWRYISEGSHLQLNFCSVVYLAFPLACTFLFSSDFLLSLT